MHTSKLFLVLGAINAFVAVAMGAFGAHILKTRIPHEMLDVYKTGVQYHFYHALGLLICGIIVLKLPLSGFIKLCGWIMFIGIVLFSGSLYILSIMDIKWLGLFTPFGGLALVSAWAFLAIGAWKAKKL